MNAIYKVDEKIWLKVKEMTNKKFIVYVEI